MTTGDGDEATHYAPGARAAASLLEARCDHCSYHAGSSCACNQVHGDQEPSSLEPLRRLGTVVTNSNTSGRSGPKQRMKKPMMYGLHPASGGGWRERVRPPRWRIGIGSCVSGVNSTRRPRAAPVEWPPPPERCADVGSSSSSSSSSRCLVGRRSRKPLLQLPQLPRAAPFATRDGAQAPLPLGASAAAPGCGERPCGARARARASSSRPRPKCPWSLPPFLAATPPTSS